MAIKLNCLLCGHTLDLSDAYEEYEGEVRCWVCSARLMVKLQEGRLKTMSGVTSGGDPADRRESGSP